MGVGLAGSGPALGVIIDVESIKAVRMLAFPDNNSLAPGQYQAGGIAGNGDVFGMAASERHDRHHTEDAIVWKRAENYDPRVVKGGVKFTPYFAFTVNEQFATELDAAVAIENGTVSQQLRQVFEDQGSPLVGTATVGENPNTLYDFAERFCQGQPCNSTWQIVDEAQNDYGVFQHAEGPLSVLDITQHGDEKAHGIHAGWANRFNRHQVNVSEGGYVGGNWNLNNFDAFFYDMNEDVFVNHSGGNGTMANNNRLVVSAFSDHSEVPPAFVASPDAVTEDNPFGWIHEFDPPTLGLTWINDDNVIVGRTLDSRPILIVPTGTDDNGFPTYDNTFSILSELKSPSEAIAISSADPAYIVGFAGAGFVQEGVVWDMNGQIIQELGKGRYPIGITHDGTVAYGSVRTYSRRDSAEEAALWYTTDNWQTFKEVLLEEFILELLDADVPGSELVDTFKDTLGSSSQDPGCCTVSGMNNAGQIVVHGIPALASVERWSSPGAVFLIDTLSLAQILKGDVNNDGSVDNLDITPFIAALAAEDEHAFLGAIPGGQYAAADIDMSGGPNNLDITPFIALLAGTVENSTVVPEPASAMLLLLPLMVVGRACRGRSRSRACSQIGHQGFTRP